MTSCRPISLSRAAAAAALLVAALAGPSAWASPTTEAQATLRKDTAVCNSGASQQDRKTCLKEAKAAYAENLRGGLDDGDARYRRNARQRCDALAGTDRDACRARMRGEGTTSGTAAGGGVSRELVTTTPAPPSDRPTTPR